MNALRVLLVDHRDSFAFLLSEQFAMRGADVRTVRAPATAAALARCAVDFAAELVVLSPGPGHPRDAVGTVAWLRSAPSMPVFGVCLGLQAMVVAAGGEVGPAPVPVHGHQHRIELGDDPFFAGLPRDFAAGRYHSLVATRMPDALVEVARATDGGKALVMAVRHRTLPWLGVQFHPESVLTPWGGDLCARVLTAASAHSGSSVATPPPRPQPAPSMSAFSFSATARPR